MGQIDPYFVLCESRYTPTP